MEKNQTMDELDLTPCYIKKYTAIKIDTNNINREIKIDLSYGSIEGPYYYEERPETEFDTEEEAIVYAVNKDKYSKWLILPVVKFNHIF
jgi:hypothetical protein